MTKIQTIVNYPPPSAELLVAGNPVEIVEKFTYLQVYETVQEEAKLKFCGL